LKRISVWLIFLAAAFLTMSEPVSASDNLAKNPSFEQVSGGIPSDWQMNAYVKGAEATAFGIESADSHSGANCAVITNSLANDSRYVQTIPVKENTNYKITCWIKTDNVGLDNKGANISIIGNTVSSVDFKGTDNSWKNAVLYVAAGKGVSSMEMSLGLGGYSSMNTGKAYFDDVLVEETAGMPEGAHTIRLSGAENNQKTEIKTNNTNNGNTKSNSYLLLIFIVVAITLIALVIPKDKKRGIKTGDSSGDGIIGGNCGRNEAAADVINSDDSEYIDDEDLI